MLSAAHVLQGIMVQNAAATLTTAYHSHVRTTGHAWM
eukprot:COSAG01_NODE_72525_length_252_cov_3.313725_1_plen_36_part_10